MAEMDAMAGLEHINLHSLTVEQIREMNSIFLLYDRDGNHTVYDNELGKVMRALGHLPTEAELAVLSEELDTLGYGTIPYHEFIEVMAKRPFGNQGSEKELREAWTAFDKYETGDMSAALFRHLMTTLGEPLTDEELNMAMKILDVDGDGNVSSDEAIKLLLGEQKPNVETPTISTTLLEAYA